MSQALINLTLKRCVAISPYLKGEIGQPEAGMLQASASNASAITQLYQQIAQCSPEAGQQYWLARSWDLLTWQPLYLAFIAIYSHRTLPDLTSMGQHQQQAMVSGFTIGHQYCRYGGYEYLIKAAGVQLSAMFDQVIVDLNGFRRCNWGYVAPFVADAILSLLLKIQAQDPKMSSALLRYHGSLWFAALDLPLKYLNALQALDGRLCHQRTSCCAVYKTRTGAVCSNCPRQRKLQ